ncbi:MAG TPA: U32 family peptidase [Rhodospirillaceae bacterium]|nr:U32 family peptidase [Rhodospirillaceae bacterium]
MTDVGPNLAKLSLGPLLFNWPAEQIRDFYFRMAEEGPFDTVHLGEVVCSKREPFFAKFIPEVMDRLTTSGKEVVISSLALVMAEKERQGVRALAEADFVVEANDISAALALVGRPFHVGPFVNVYNEGTLVYLSGMGMKRVCLPAELSGATLAILAAQKSCEIEVQAFGRLPLAVSARCYHARLHDLHKDGCQYVCAEDADGLAVDTMDGKPFLAINGTQTMSERYVNLLGQVRSLGQAGVSRFRLWPHHCDMVAVGRLFRNVLDGQLDAKAANRQLAELVPDAAFSNGYIHGLEGHRLIDDDLLIA